VELLLNRGAYLDAIDRKSETALSRAAANGHRAVVQLLIGRSACVDLKDTWNAKTLLSWLQQTGMRP
jgi:ankyrin repeat protein